MNEQEILLKLNNSRQYTRELEKQLKDLRLEEYKQSILALKDKCYARKSMFEDKWECLYKIIDCSPEYTSSDLKVVAVKSLSNESYSIERVNYSGNWFEDNDYEEISNEDFIYTYTIILQKINELQLIK